MYNLNLISNDKVIMLTEFRYLPVGASSTTVLDDEAYRIEEMRDQDEWWCERGAVEVLLDQIVALELPDGVGVVLDG